MGNKRRISIQLLVEEDDKFFKELLARSDVEIVSFDAAAEYILVEQEFIIDLQNEMKKRAEEKGFFTHELKNPLASVKGYADVLLSGMAGKLTEQQEKILKTIRSSANKMQVMIDDLSDTAKLSTGPLHVDKSPFEVMLMINETLRPFERLFSEKEQTVTTSIPDDLPPALGDETRFIQVLTNLISNAHKYSPDKGHIQIVAKSVGDFVQFSISDNGIGMNETDLTEIFSDKSIQQESGRGLGMIISKNIIHSHNGEIWAESELGKGSTFHFTIPIVQNDEN